MRNWLWLIAATILPLLWFMVHFFPGVVPFEITPGINVAFSGLAIVGAAFFLSWSIELLEHDIPSSLSLIIVSLVSVLPEYAVDITFAWKAGLDNAACALGEPYPPGIGECNAPLAIANMTGANRILIGLGWAVVVCLAWFRTRRPRVEVNPKQKLEIAMLLIATIYSFIIPLKGTLSWTDAVAFGLMFVVYAVLASRGESEENELVGPPAILNELLSDWGRRGVAVLMLTYGAISIYIAAEPFAHNLVELGTALNINKFLLVQWLAPLASESPEFLVAILFVLKNRPSTGLGALISSKVNQWTLLVGAIPIAYGISKGVFDPMILDPVQRDELLLTSAQSLLAVMFLIRMRLTVGEGFVLLFLFGVQLLLGMPSIANFVQTSAGMSLKDSHAYFSIVYFVLVIAMFFRRGQLLAFWKALTFRAGT
jgi:cation:H+ antiporter